MLENSRLTSNGRRNVFTNSRKELDIDRLRISRYDFKSEMNQLFLTVTTHLFIRASMSS